MYARVSGHDQKESLDLQVARIVQKYQGKIDKVVTEIGSGMNPGRAKINSLLADPQITTIVVENKDKLARMNVELVESALRAQGRNIAYIDDTEVEDDTVQDIIDFMTSVCARMYGKRGRRKGSRETCSANCFGGLILVPYKTTVLRPYKAEVKTGRGKSLPPTRKFH